jgi:hypothetical protein
MEPLADLVCTLYHEARNIRFPLQAGLITHNEVQQYKLLTSLPKNREDAWGQMQPLRIAASAVSGSLSTVYEKKFGLTVGQLADLFERPIWRDSFRGGNKWGAIARKVQECLVAHASGDLAKRDNLIQEVLLMSHNTGMLSTKLRDLKKSL